MCYEWGLYREYKLFIVVWGLGRIWSGWISPPDGDEEGFLARVLTDIECVKCLLIMVPAVAVS